MRGGFLQLRRGLLEHVTKGAISRAECFLVIAIMVEADSDTGIWIGSAGLLASLYGLSARTARDLIEKLELKGYIKRFSVPGSHSNYPILVNKYECSDGAMKGMRLNAVATTDRRNRVYESCEESVERGVKHGAGIKEENREQRIKGASPKKSAPPFVLPDWVPSEPWADFVEMHGQMRKPMTDKAKRLVVAELEKLRAQGFEAGGVLNQSILHSWPDVFPLRNKTNGSPGSGNHTQTTPTTPKTNPAELSARGEEILRKAITSA